MENQPCETSPGHPNRSAAERSGAVPEDWNFHPRTTKRQPVETARGMRNVKRLPSAISDLRRLEQAQAR